MDVYAEAYGQPQVEREPAGRTILERWIVYHHLFDISVNVPRQSILDDTEDCTCLNVLARWMELTS